MPVTEAPYYGDGSLANYPESYRGTQMMPIVPFGAKLKLTEWTKGRSAVNFYFKDESNGRSYPMFAKDFFDLVVSHDLHKGEVGYRMWTVVKRGQNYGIIPLTQ